MIIVTYIYIYITEFIKYIYIIQIILIILKIQLYIRVDQKESKSLRLALSNLFQEGDRALSVLDYDYILIW